MRNSSKFLKINYSLNKYFRVLIISCITSGSLVTSFTYKALGQITPDTTLPNNSSVKVQGNTSIIEAGTKEGGNLFHSFKEFSVTNGSETIFNNTVDIQNVITRVTGQSASNLNGIIKTLGEANLFLINPNGIIFGENARLDIGGSFIGSTANAIQFGNFGTFSATNPLAETSLLTVNPSALLFSQSQAGSIEINSVAPSGNNPSNTSIANGLRVRDRKSLLLVGGDVNISSGGLYAFGGRVELGGLNGTGTVGLNKDSDNFSLSFPSEVNKSDVSFNNNANVDVRADNGGSIAINAHNLVLTGGSKLWAGIGNRLGTDNSKAGNIDINATGTSFVQNSVIYNFMEPNALGQGGDINIKTNTLRLEDGGQVSASTFGASQGGNVKTDATSLIELIGRNTDGFPSGLFVGQTTKGATGNAGSLTINTPMLRVLDGANVNGATSGAGRGGDLIVNARIIEVIGASSDGFGSAIDAQAKPTALGKAGDLTIKTDELLIQNGGFVGAVTFGVGNGGNVKIDATLKIELIGINNIDGRFSSGLSVAQVIRGATGNGGSLTINTPILRVLDGASVFASTFGAGRAGDLTINARKIEIIGTSNNGYISNIIAQADSSATGAAGNLAIKTDQLLVQNGGLVSASTFGAGQGGNLKIDATSKIELIGVNRIRSGFASGLFVIQGRSGATGNAGDLTINTDQLLVQDSASIAARSVGTGTAGNLTINANSVNLDRNATLTANTRSNRTNVTQTTININSRNLTLRRNSSITTNATNPSVIGGDININTDVLGAFENSKITANSANFRGGNINIKTQALFRSFDSAITASGATSELSGNVNVTTIIDPNRGLVEIPINLVDPSGLILARCSPSRNSPTQNSFTVTGRGGLPISPEDLLQDVDTIANWINSSSSLSSTIEQSIQAQKGKTANPLVEASGWKVDIGGQVYLVASTQDVQSQYLPSQPNFCPG